MLKKRLTLKEMEERCFLCSKVGVGFELDTLKFILQLPLCSHHTEITENTIAKGERQPGEDDE